MTLEEATHYLRQPGKDGATFPFSTRSSAKKPAASSGSSNKGKRPKPSASLRKYRAGRLPAEIKILLEKKWPLLKEMRASRWRTVLEELGSKSLARNTWAKYSSALKMYSRFCKEMKIEFDLPVSRERADSFIIWGAEERGVGAGSLAAYLAAVQSLGRFFDRSGGGLRAKCCCRV